MRRPRHSRSGHSRADHRRLRRGTNGPVSRRELDAARCEPDRTIPRWASESRPRRRAIGSCEVPDRRTDSRDRSTHPAISHGACDSREQRPAMFAIEQNFVRAWCRFGTGSGMNLPRGSARDEAPVRRIHRVHWPCDCYPVLSKRLPLLRHCASAVCVRLRPGAIWRVLLCSDTSARVVLAASPLRGQDDG